MGPPHIQREGSRGPGQLRMAGPFLQAAASQSQETQSQGSLLLPRAARLRKTAWLCPCLSLELVTALQLGLQPLESSAGMSPGSCQTADGGS